MRTVLIILVLWFSALGMRAENPILGASEVSPEAMAAFVARRNPDFDPQVAEAFHTVGARYGIRGDIALCQAIIETGWFRFDGGTAVTPDQHNYCGMGVTVRGEKGCTFESVEQGVTALIQHLYAYCCTGPLPDGEPLLDPRYNLVARGVAPNWEDLVGRWAMNPNYTADILSLYSHLLAESR